MSKYKYFRNALGIDPVSSDPANPSEGLIQFSDGTHRPAGLWQYKSGAWASIGGGGGGLDVFFTEDHETNGVGNYSSGNNATIGGAGSLDGTLATETSVPLSGDTSFKYTHGSSSTNDYILSEAITLEPKQQDNYLAVNFVYTYDGADDDMRAFLYDETNDEVIGGYLDLKASSVSKPSTIQRFISSSVSSLKLGLQTVTGNSGSILLLDDVEFTTNPLVFQNLTSRQTYVLRQAHSAMTNRAAEVEFNLGTATISDTGDTLLIAEDDSANTRTKFIAQQACHVKYNFVGLTTSNADTIDLYKNGVVIKEGQQASAGVTRNDLNGSIYLAAGDYLSFGASGGLTSSANICYLELNAEADVEHLVSNQTTGANWTAYTPTTQGFGTITGLEAFYKRNGDSYDIFGRFTTGTVTAVEAQIGLPNNKTISSKLTSIQSNGKFSRNQGNTEDYNVLLTAGDSFINIGRVASATATLLTPQIATNICGNTVDVTFMATVPIEGLDLENSVTVVSPLRIPVSKIRFTGGNGRGSTNTAQRRYTTLQEQVGTAITYTDSAADGTTFNIEEDGIYSIYQSDSSASISFAFGIVKNPTTLTTGIGAISVDERLTYTVAKVGNVGYPSSTQITTRLDAGDTIVVQTEASGTYGTADAAVIFTIERIF